MQKSALTERVQTSGAAGPPASAPERVQTSDAARAPASAPERVQTSDAARAPASVPTRAFEPAVGEILAVDDSLANLLAIEAALGEFGAHVVKTQSGADALRRLLTQDFALILLDVQMP